MSKITVWKSDMDGKLFEDKSKYVKHLRTLAAKNILKRKFEHKEATRPIIMQKMGQVKSSGELTQFIKDNWQWFWLNGAARCTWRWKDKPPIHELVDIRITGLKWDEHLSNSHSCPQGGVSNFGRGSDYGATGYPGWKGQIHIEIKPPSYMYKKKSYIEEGWGSDYFDDTIINTGSGGGGGGPTTKKYTYGLTLWAADFPVIYEKQRRWQWCEEENRKRKFVWKSLGGNQAVPEVYEVPEDWVLISPWSVHESTLS